MHVMVFLIVVALVFGIGATALGTVNWTLRNARHLPDRLRRTLPPPQPRLARLDPSPHPDLTTYPTQLEALEKQLQSKIVLVEQQQRIVATRIDELASKPGRDELSRKYNQDAQLLHTRQRSMERVLAKVWKTRSILLLRVHLAITARQKPSLSTLPDPEDPKLDPQKATQAFHHASDAVRHYLRDVDDRKKSLFRILPDFPSSADPDPTIQAAVTQEARTIDTAYSRLQDQMDRLADNLTYLGDHFATVAVINSREELHPNKNTRHPEEAGRLLDEVEDALSSLEALATSVDPTTIDAAVSHLARDISRLEEAGQEAVAEAEASLEVDAILHSTHP